MWRFVGHVQASDSWSVMVSAPSPQIFPPVLAPNPPHFLLPPLPAYSPGPLLRSSYWVGLGSLLNIPERDPLLWQC